MPAVITDFYEAITQHFSEYYKMKYVHVTMPLDV